MSDIPTPVDVVHRLVNLAGLLDKAQSDLETQGEETVRLRQKFEVSEAKAFLNADASNAETKKRMALLAAADEKLEAALAEEKLKAIRSRIEVLRVQVGNAQSVGTAVRSEWAAS